MSASVRGCPCSGWSSAPVAGGRVACPGAGQRHHVGAGSTTRQAGQHTDEQQSSPGLLRRPTNRIDRHNPGLGPHERAPRLAPRSARRRHRRRLQHRALNCAVEVTAAGPGVRVRRSAAGQSPGLDRHRTPANHRSPTQPHRRNHQRPPCRHTLVNHRHPTRHHPPSAQRFTRASTHESTTTATRTH